MHRTKIALHKQKMLDQGIIKMCSFWIVEYKKKYIVQTFGEDNVDPTYASLTVLVERLLCFDKYRVNQEFLGD